MVHILNWHLKVLREKLIKAGYSFRTNSDTEVILLGYEEYGVEILNKLEGMFAFVIYDLNEKKWILARDRTGEKPLYYHIDPEKAIFASELKSITAISDMATFLFIRPFIIFKKFMMVSLP